MPERGSQTPRSGCGDGVAAEAAQPETLYVVALGAGLAALVVAVFAASVRHGFVNVDDGLYVLETPQVQQGLSWDGLRWAFTTLHASNWHPLTWVSLQLDTAIWGVVPSGYHLTNLVLHTAATLTLFALLVHETGRAASSALAAALFGVHPLHVESVAWISERKDVLSALFAFLALWAYQRFARTRSLRHYALVTVAFGLGLLSKPMLVTLPVLFLAWDYWPLQRVGRLRAVSSLVLEKAPWFALSLAIGLVTLRAQAGSAVVALGDLSLGTRLAQALVSTAWYLAKTVWPSGLAAFYPYDKDIPTWAVASSAAVLLAITAAAAVVRRGPLVTGWIWYVVSLLPVLGIVQVGAQARADRYTYLPLVGLFIAFAWALPLDAVANRSTAWIRGAARALAGALMLALAVAAYAQTEYWKDGRALMERAVAVTERNWFAHNALGRLATEEGRLADAEQHLAAAVRFAPEHPDVWFNVGVLQAEAQRWESSSMSMRTALRLRPGWAEAHYNLGRALQSMNRLGEAFEQYQAAVALRPNYSDAHNNLAAAHLARGELEAAERSAREASRLEPRSPYPHVNLALVLLYRGDVVGARREASIARALGGQVPTQLEEALAADAGVAQTPDR